VTTSKITLSRTLLPLAAAALLIAGCGGGANETPASSSSSGAPASTAAPTSLTDQQAPPKRLTVDVTIKGGTVTPTNQALQAGLGDPIVIRVNSDAEDELHVHSSPDHSFKIEAKPSQQFQFTVDVPGKVDVELHHAGVTIATITVQ
jgi:sporulation-control protein spo0M